MGSGVCDKEVTEVCGLSNWNNEANISEIVQNVEQSALVGIREDRKFSVDMLSLRCLLDI